MPTGYLVNLGDGQLDTGDQITSTTGTFNTERVLGNGSWTWSGDAGGTAYTNEWEPGTYYLADTGDVYFVPSYGMVDTLESASVSSVNTNDEVDGTGGSDTIGAGYSDVEGDDVDDGTGGGGPAQGNQVNAGAGNDSVTTGAGNDTVLGGSGDDTIYGGAGDDSLVGGEGNDQIYGQDGNDTLEGDQGHDTIDGGEGADSISGGSGDDQIMGGGGHDTVHGGTGRDTIDGGSGDDQLSGGGDNDSLRGGDGNDTLTGDDPDATETVHINTSNFADTTSGYTLTAQNVENGVLTTASADNVSTSGGGLGASGTISDSDSGQANQLGYDMASGLSENITVTLDQPIDTASFSFAHLYTSNYAEQAQWSVYDGNTLVAQGVFTEQGAGSGSGTVNISGVGSFDSIVFSALPQTDGSDGSDYVLTDINFEASVPQTEGNDTLDGGSGADVMDGGRGDDSLIGGSGDDTIYVSEGDTAVGNTGDDLFIVQDNGETGAQDIIIDGGTEANTDFDVLDLRESGFTDYEITSTNPETGESSGRATLQDGSVVQFSNIEQVVTCFGHGTLIQTECGPRPVQTLQNGDRILTRDHGMQPLRYLSMRMVVGTGKAAPIRFEAGAIGNSRALTVSPEHRMVVRSVQAELMFASAEVFVPAKLLVNGVTVRRMPTGMVRYYHLLLPSHEVIFAEDAMAESFMLNPRSFGLLPEAVQDDMLDVCPDLAGCADTYGPAARYCVSRREVSCLI